MPSMLEQALVDAEALRSAALKSAEAKVLEEAAPRIREAVAALLEQEEEDLGDLEGLDGMDAGMGMPGPELGAGAPGEMAATLPMGVQNGEKMCPCPEDEEEIEIDFGQLEQQMMADEETASMGQDDLAAGLNLSGPGDDLGVPMGDDNDFALEEEFELDESIIAALLEEMPGEMLDQSAGVVSETVDSRKAKIDVAFHSMNAVLDEAWKLAYEEGLKDARSRSKVGQTPRLELVAEKMGVILTNLYDEGYEDGEDELRDADSWSTGEGNAVWEGQEELEEVGRTPATDKMMAQHAADDSARAADPAASARAAAASAAKAKANRQRQNADADKPKPQDWMMEKKITEAVRSVTANLFKDQEELRAESKKLNSYVKRLSESLKSANLDNARLLYSNQILESDSLNERQKRKIVEAVSRTGSVEEAKVTYETLISTVGTLNESKREPQSLREAIERPSTPLFPRRKPEASSPERERMQKLAGIK